MRPELEQVHSYMDLTSVLTKFVWIEVVLLYCTDLYCSVLFCATMCTVMFTDVCTVKCTVVCAVKSGKVSYKRTVSSQ